MSTSPIEAFDPEGVDLVALERRFRRALVEADPGDLPVVGYGEISLAFAWPPHEPTVVVKSLPVFAERARLEAYAQLVDDYVATLRSRGVDVVPTVVRPVRAPEGWRGFLLQPCLPREAIGPAVLAAGGPDAQALLTGVVEHAVHAIDDRVGLDAQVSNWAVVDGRLRYLDVGTPMLRDRDGHDRLDVRVLATSVPWIVRGLVVHVVAPGILAPYYDPRPALLDAAGNLVRERLSGWIERLLDVANPHLERPLREPEVRRFYRSNARLYAALQSLRRLDRTWQHRVRGRPYPFLLPEHYER